MRKSIKFSILAGCLCALPVAALSNVQPVGPTPANNAGNWVTTDDYPPVALRSKIGGTTVFKLSIDDQGNVAACNIVQTSGSPDLDAATCDLLIMRARFNPATDQDGRPVASVYRSKIKWVIPIEPVDPTPKPWESMLRRMIVETDGRPSHCEYGRKTRSGVDYTPEPCPTTIYDPYRDANGRPVRKLVTMVNTITVEDVSNF